MRIIVRIRNGEIAGTISPFGAQERQEPAVYTIPLPAGAVKDGIARLLVEVERKTAEPARPRAKKSGISRSPMSQSQIPAGKLVGDALRLRAL